MTAFLWKLLVLQLDRRSAGALVAANGMADVEEAAVAGVPVGDQRGAGHSRHDLDPPDHVGVAREPRVGQAKMGRDGSVAGHVESIESHTRGHAQRDHVVDAGRRDEAVLGSGVQNLAESQHGENPQRCA